jgi:Protein of unknown function (DUF3106)
MKKQFAVALLVLVTGPLAAAPAATPASGPSDSRRQAAAERWRQMTPEEQAAAKARARARYDAMTPEQKAAMRERMAERHPQAARRMSSPPGASAPTAPVAPQASAPTR